jgi:hypothetical protein
MPPRQKKPKPPKEAKVDRPSTRELREAYKMLLTPDIGQRIDALVRAMQWYDAAFDYVIVHQQSGVATSEQEKAISVAGKCRLLGQSSGFNAEKENSFFKAVRHYEKALGEPMKAPSIMLFADILKAQEGKLSDRQFRLERKFGSVLGLLQAALKPVSAQGKEIALKAGQIDQPTQTDHELSQVSFRKDFIHKLRRTLRREGLLRVVLDVLDPVASACACEALVDSEGKLTGGYQTRAVPMMKAQRTLWENLFVWCRTSPDVPKRLVRPERTVVAPTDGQPAKERKGGFGAGRPKVDGLFVEGSKRAALYVYLRDAQEHKMEDIAKVTYPESAKGVLFRVERRGIKSGRYTIVQQGDVVRLRFNEQPQSQGA